MHLPAEDTQTFFGAQKPGSNATETTPTVDKTTRLSNILVYEWKAWDGFLISKLVEDRCRVTVSFSDDFARLDSAITPEIEVVLFQINLTMSHQFPQHRQHLIESLRDRGLKVFNCAIDDITKRNLHTLLNEAGIPSAKAEREGNPTELLFIKSNLNWGGEKESGISASELEKYGVDVPGNRINQHSSYYTTMRKYLPEEVWEDSTVVVERYVENPENSFYRVYKIGQSIVVVKAHAPELIKKISGHKDDINHLFSKDAILLNDTHLPRNLQRVIRQFLLNIDLEYFCLDLVHDMNNFYIIDLNLTPFHGSHDANPVVNNFMIKGILQQIKNPH